MQGEGQQKHCSERSYEWSYSSLSLLVQTNKKLATKTLQKSSAPTIAYMRSAIEACSAGLRVKRVIQYVGELSSKKRGGDKEHCPRAKLARARWESGGRGSQQTDRRSKVRPKSKGIGQSHQPSHTSPFPSRQTGSQSPSEFRT